MQWPTGHRPSCWSRKHIISDSCLFPHPLSRPVNSTSGLAHTHSHSLSPLQPSIQATASLEPCNILSALYPATSMICGTHVRWGCFPASEASENAAPWGAAPHGPQHLPDFSSHPYLTLFHSFCPLLVPLHDMLCFPLMSLHLLFSSF